jgi:hypothetical protein
MDAELLLLRSELVYGELSHCSYHALPMHIADPPNTESTRTWKRPLRLNPAASLYRPCESWAHQIWSTSSISQSRAAYINTLTYAPHDKQHKVVSGLYWYEDTLWL